MSQETSIQLFGNAKIRVVWDDEAEKYYFSVVDVIGVLTEQTTPRGASTYWAVVKKRLNEEGANEMLTGCKQLKMPAPDGKMRLTDAADLVQILRIIQSIPSKKAEPLKRWLAEVTTEISKRKNPSTMQQNMQIATEGGNVAKAARNQLEATIGESVVSPIKASDYIHPIEEGKADELPFDEKNEK